MTQADFLNALKVLANIDGDELMRAGLTFEQAWSFVRSPWREFIKLPDVKAAAVWSIVERRMQPRAEAA